MSRKNTEYKRYESVLDRKAAVAAKIKRRSLKEIQITEDVDDYIDDEFDEVSQHIHQPIMKRLSRKS